MRYNWDYRAVLLAVLLSGGTAFAQGTPSAVIGGPPAAAAPCSAFGTTAGTCTQGNDARLGAGAVTGAVKSNGSNTFTQAECADLSNAGTGCTATLGGYATISAGVITNSITSDVALNNVATYFVGPTVAQGSTGTWCASGTITLSDTTIAQMAAQLTDGTTVIAATVQEVPINGTIMSVSLSGCIASPAGNLRISAKDVTNTTGAIKANSTGLGNKDSTITAWRVN